MIKSDLFEFNLNRTIDYLPKPPPIKKPNPELEEPEECGMNLANLPVLPFEKILRGLSLEDRIRFRRVSKGCSIWIVHVVLPEEIGAFAQNFICSPRFTSFFATFHQTIFSNLKHLHLFGLILSEEKGTAFIQTPNSLDQLKELDII